MHVHVSIIIVNYNSSEYLVNCLISIKKFTNAISYEIIVVDNDSPDGKCVHLQNRFPWVKFFFLKKNIGYGAANNYGFLEAKGKYILLLNPDTLFIENSLLKMYEYIEQKDNIGAIGPILLNLDRSYQHSFGKIISLIELFFKAFYMHKFYNKLVYKLVYKRKIKEQISFNIEWITGAALFVKSQIYRKISGFNEDIFLYNEDVEICGRIRQAGHAVKVFTLTKIIHLGGKSTGKFPNRLVVSRFKSLYLVSNIFLSPFKKYFFNILIFSYLYIRILVINIWPFFTRNDRIERYMGYKELLQWLKRKTVDET